MNTEQLKRDPMKETEQTLLDQIKNQVAKEQYCTGWKHLSHKYPSSIDAKFWPIVCERYATAKAKASCEATPVSAPSESQEEMYNEVRQEYLKHRGRIWTKEEVMLKWIIENYKLITRNP